MNTWRIDDLPDDDRGDHHPPVDAAGNLHAEFRRFWHPIAWCDEIGESPFATSLLGVPLVAVRDANGQVRCFVDACPHRGAPLSMGCVENNELVCPFHGWRFGLDGAATRIPSAERSAPIPSRARLEHPAAVAERYGMVWVALDEAVLPITEWPDGDDPSLGELRPIAHESTVLAAYQTENLLDASHFPFLHGALGHRNPLMLDAEVLDDAEFGFRSVVRKVEHDDVTTEGWLRYTLDAPFTVLLRSEEPDGGLRTSFFQAIQPIDDRRTRMFFLIRVPETDPARLADLLVVEQRILDEDHRMNSALRRTAMPLTGAPDLHVRADRNGVMYRRVLRRVLGGMAATGDER